MWAVGLLHNRSDMDLMYSQCTLFLYCISVLLVIFTDPCLEKQNIKTCFHKWFLYIFFNMQELLMNVSGCYDWDAYREGIRSDNGFKIFYFIPAYIFKCVIWGTDLIRLLPYSWFKKSWTYPQSVLFVSCWWQLPLVVKMISWMFFTCPHSPFCRPLSSDQSLSDFPHISNDTVCSEPSSRPAVNTQWQLI